MLFTVTRLGDNLKRLRKRTGMSQVKLAGISGISLGYITKIEQGVAGSRISAAKSKALADALGVTVDDLVGDLGPLNENSLPQERSERTYEELVEAMTTREIAILLAMISAKLHGPKGKGDNIEPPGVGTDR